MACLSQDNPCQPLETTSQVPCLPLAHQECLPLAHLAPCLPLAPMLSQLDSQPHLMPLVPMALCLPLAPQPPQLVLQLHHMACHLIVSPLAPSPGVWDLPTTLHMHPPMLLRGTWIPYEPQLPPGAWSATRRQQSEAGRALDLRTPSLISGLSFNCGAPRLPNKMLLKSFSGQPLELLTPASSHTPSFTMTSGMSLHSSSSSLTHTPQRKATWGWDP
mmetsp:Transcript_38138/g.92770  ORF Transcript_38138/g.92770 Transcript_38138/m.92770 type:complete len:217 (+) Transcript_38138:701-1351(+)